MDILGLADIMKFAGALLFVLALMLGLSLIMRKINARGGFALAPTRQRLKIIETLPLTPRHRMMLVKRDDREHLVIIGPAGETVVESGIIPPSPSLNQTGEETA